MYYLVMGLVAGLIVGLALEWAIDWPMFRRRVNYRGMQRAAQSGDTGDGPPPSGDNQPLAQG